MAFTEEMKKKITDSAILQEITDMEKNLHEVTEESKTRKTRVRDYETQINLLKEKMKKSGLDPEGDLEEQLKETIEKSKKGLKEESEFEAITKKMDKLAKEVDSWKEAAQKSTQEALMAKARSAFQGKIGEHFGKAGELILDLGLSKGLIAVNDGVPGVFYEEEFTPMNVEKGKNAFDILRKLYPDLAITKQVTGGKDVNTKHNADSTLKTLSMNDFDTLTHPEKQEFVKSGGKIE